MLDIKNHSGFTVDKVSYVFVIKYTQLVGASNQSLFFLEFIKYFIMYWLFTYNKKNTLKTIYKRKRFL